ncbi:MAG: xanthine dehydrogenase family protein molybdopterin-binding subunit [Methyloligellaceae bacterium]
MLEFRKEIFADERDDDLNEIGRPTQRQDMLGHVTARTRFFDDHAFDGLLHLRCVRSPHHHARIRNIDTSQAERVPGVVRIIRGEDVPVNLNTMLHLINFGKDDEPSLATAKVAYVGEPVVAIVAESEAAAREAVAKVTIGYDSLPHVLEVEAALQPGAPIVNETYPGNYFEYHGGYDRQKLRFGDVQRAFTEADHVLEDRYVMSPIEHAPAETNGCIAAPETNDRVVVHTSTQALFFSLGNAAKILNMPSNRLHFIGGTVGGGFGGKVDTLTEPLAILACRLTGRPVRYVLDRAEEMQVGAPRGAEIWDVKDGVVNDGRIVARELRGYFDTGAYTRLSSYAVIKATGHLPGPYTIPNVKSDVFAVYTNRTPATAMRGFGVTGVDFAIECHMDKMAHLVGMDPIEFRIANAYRDGDMKAHRREAKNCALIECCQVAAEKASWQIRDEYRAMSSREGGGGDRALIPETALDSEGRVGAGGAPAPRPLPPEPAPAPLAARAATPPLPAARDTAPAPQPAAAAPPASSSPPASRPAPTQPPPARQPEAPPAPSAPATSRSRPAASPRPGTHRFSSVSGTRRR